MSRSRPPLAGLAAVTAAAGLALTGCHSSSTGTASGTATATAAGSTAAGATAAGASSAGVSTGSGNVAYFPDQLGDTWVYSVDLNGSKGKVTNRVTAVTPIAGGTRVTMTDTDTAISSGKPFELTYVVHSDGSISIPLNLDGGSGIKVTAGGLGWPDPAQLASQQPENDTMTMSETVSGTTVKVTVKAVIKGEGTQSVSVPAGDYRAIVVDETDNEKFQGYAVTSDDKTWLVDGIGPVQTQVGSAGSGGLSETEQLISFTKG